MGSRFYWAFYKEVWCDEQSQYTLRWRHYARDSVSNHQPHDCLLNHLFRRRSRKTSKLRVTGLCARNSPGTGEFPAQMASNAENVSIWWRHHVIAVPWWHDMDTLSVSFTLCNGSQLDSLHKGPGMTSFDFNHNRVLSSQWSCRSFETPWRQCDVTLM